MANAGPPSKEYRARIFVRLSDDLLPTPVLSEAELGAQLTEALNAGKAGFAHRGRHGRRPANHQTAVLSNRPLQPIRP